MKRFRKIIITVLPILIIVSLAVGSFFFFNGRQQAQPDNPLLKDAVNSHMLLSFGGELEFFENAPEDSKEDENSDVTAADTTEKTVKETTLPETTKPENNEPETKKPEQTTSENKTKNEEKKQEEVTKADRKKPSLNSLDVTEVNKDNEELSTSPNVSDTENEGEADAEITITEPESEAEETIFSSDGEVKDEISGEVQKPLEEETDKVYFTTSIKDGETVKKSDYSFEIYHNYSELTVSSVRVYVNDTEIPQFKGNVPLSEGDNTIRVAVEYKDENGKVISVYQNYTVKAELGKIKIETDLTSHETENEVLSFTASASYGGESIPVTVTLNNQSVTAESGKYSVKLKNGENRVVISASNGEASVEKEYKITCKASEGLAIFTDLKDYETDEYGYIIVHTDSIEFTAYVLNGTSRAKLSVTCHGNPVKGTNNKFTAEGLTLGNDLNVINLKATDKVNGESVTARLSFVVKYVPLADEETAPYLRYINVTDGMTVKGNEFIINIDPVDYLGNRIYDEGITVDLNGATGPWEDFNSEYSSYLLWFKGGQNELNIRITDKDGRYTDYSYRITCETFEEGEEIGTIKVSVDAVVLGLNYIIYPTDVSILQGETGADTIERFFKENGFTTTVKGTTDEGYYLARISKNGIGVGVEIDSKLEEEVRNYGENSLTGNRDDNSLGEFDYYTYSGWMYELNGSYAGYGFAKAAFKDGDIVRIRFTLARGADLASPNGDNYGKFENAR